MTMPNQTYYTVVAKQFAKEKLFHTNQVLDLDRQKAIDAWLYKNGNTATWDELEGDWIVVAVNISAQ